MNSLIVCLMVVFITFVSAQKGNTFVGDDGQRYRWLSSAERFRQCCRGNAHKRGRMQPKCAEACSYDSMNDKLSILGTIATQTCSIHDLGSMLFCASRFHDHKECCVGQGVPETCLSYCRPAFQRISGDFKYLYCLDHTAAFDHCFQGYDQTNPVYIQIKAKPNNTTGELKN